MSRILVGALALALAFAGCQGGDEEESGADQESRARSQALERPRSSVRETEIRAPASVVAPTAIAAPRSRVDAILRQLGARSTRRGIVITLPETVLFAFNRAELRPGATSTLGKIAEVARRYPNAPLEIRGHTDSVGSARYTLALSQRRAQAVKDYLARRGGIAPTRLRARGFGETRPVAPNRTRHGSDNPRGRQQNRRVEVIVRGARARSR